MLSTAEKRGYAVPVATTLLALPSLLCKAEHYFDNGHPSVYAGRGRKASM